MVLYEDLRIYTIWRTDLARSKQEASDYKKSAEEWEILGELAERLHHFPEAVEAYQACLRIRFSPKAMRGVLKMYEKEGRYGEMLQALIRLIAWQYRWYSEVSVRFCGYPVRGANCWYYSSLQRFYVRCVSSSRKRVQSRSAALCKLRAYRSQCWISLIVMYSFVRRFEVAVAMVNRHTLRGL